ncbi:unnamed protein product [Medioppia subpectinata]|uniref:Transporter n=1 Tax=Medioppia subpectinata TaxID=1979941 RepID=A0A7R9Q315_9ACAR|nr:unnamed protein product [Medioppia subpectinata]CAG2110947.1 unnamed protein product [Medioppia subpectinata]
MDTNTETTVDKKPRNEPKNEHKKEKWGTKLEFLLTCLSYVIGFGNIWRFPYICYKNGGGAFLIPYFLSLGFIGFPLMVIEMTLGQYSAKGKVSVWQFIMVAVQAVYYNMLVGWSLRYFLASFTFDDLPWKRCNHTWNTGNCTEGQVGNSSNLKSPSDEYFHEDVLAINKDIADVDDLRWDLVFCLFMAWLMVFLSVSRGVKGIGKISYFTTLFPYVCLTILFIRGITLEGAWNGISFYITPDWTKLFNTSVWIDASQQIFFSLSISWGTMITLSSYNNFENHLILDATIIAFGNSMTSIAAGFVIFAYMGAVAHVRGVDVSKVATSGSGLAFMMYPEAVAMFPWGQLFSAVFFFMLILLGMGSQTPNIESLLSAVLDFRPDRRKYRLFILLQFCIIGFLLGLIYCNTAGMYWFTLFNDFVASTSAMFVGLVEVVSIAWVYGIDKFMDHMTEMAGNPPTPKLFWKIVWKYVTPIALIFLLIATLWTTKAPEYRDYIYPTWTVLFGWAVIVLQVLPIPVVAMYYLCKCYRENTGIKDVSVPDVDWKNKDTSSSESNGDKPPDNTPANTPDNTPANTPDTTPAN